MRMLRRPAVFLSLLTAACAGANVSSSEETDGNAEALSTCTAYGGPVDMGTIEWTVGSSSRDEVNEGSGIAASWAHDSVYYIVDDGSAADNQADARFFAINRNGKALGRFKLTAPAANIDWEDIAVGPCASAGLGRGSCVFIADIGNNGLDRVRLQLYVMPEPTNVVAGFDTRTVSSWKRFDFAYAGDIQRNAETLMVHPVTGDVYVVTKRNLDAEVFVMRSPLTASMTAAKLATLPQSRFNNAPFTGGDFHGDGRRLVLRSAATDGKLYELRNTGDGWDDIWKTATSTFVGPWQGGSPGQGEAVTYSRSGASLYSLSEGTSRKLYRTGCQ